MSFSDTYGMPLEPTPGARIMRVHLKAHEAGAYKKGSIIVLPDENKVMHTCRVLSMALDITNGDYGARVEIIPPPEPPKRVGPKADSPVDGSPA